MVYVGYNQGKITKFSDVCPEKGRYFEIDEKGLEELRRARDADDFHTMLVREHKPAQLVHAKHWLDDDGVFVSVPILNLVGQSLRDLGIAQKDLATILEGERVLAEYDHD